MLHPSMTKKKGYVPAANKAGIRAYMCLLTPSRVYHSGWRR